VARRESTRVGICALIGGGELYTFHREESSYVDPANRVEP
jgi:hypothetical protein